MSEYADSPDPAEMVRDLQRALYGNSYATAHSPAEEWNGLLGAVAWISPLQDTTKECVMCGAMPGEPCIVISDPDLGGRGAVRPTPHFYRGAGMKPGQTRVGEELGGSDE